MFELTLAAPVNHIGGREVLPSTGCDTPLTDPATGAEYGRASLSRESDVDAAFASAREAFEGWRRQTPGERQALLLAVVAEMEARSDEFVDLECRDTGRDPAAFRNEELGSIIDQARFLSSAARALEGRAAAEYASGHTSMIRREPLGVVAQIAPWNYPMMTAVWKIFPALATGNTVVFKPDEHTPSTALLIAQICVSHLPDGCVNVVCGDRETGRLVASHPGAAMVALTGSVPAGAAVARASADLDLRPVHLELGGNAPVLVFDDADLVRAAHTIADAAFYNAGQDCTAASRVLVHTTVHDAFVAALRNEASARIDAGGIQPLISAQQLARVDGLVSRRPEHSQLVIGGEAEDRVGYYFQPTVITGVEQDDEIVQSEIFGPVLTVQSFESEQEALALANGVSQGLASSVWTRDLGRAMRVTSELDFGITWVNTHIVTVAEMPHGGFKTTGGAKDLSVYGVESYTRIKHVMLAWD